MVEVQCLHCLHHFPDLRVWRCHVAVDVAHPAVDAASSALATHDHGKVGAICLGTNSHGTQCSKAKFSLPRHAYYVTDAARARAQPLPAATDNSCFHRAQIFLAPLLQTAVDCIEAEMEAASASALCLVAVEARFHQRPQACRCICSTMQCVGFGLHGATHRKRRKFHQKAVCFQQLGPSGTNVRGPAYHPQQG